MPESNEELAEAKRTLRDSMRRMRRGLPDRDERSARIVEHLLTLRSLTGASRVMAYEPVVGEVDPGGVVDWLQVRGVEVRMPEHDVASDWPDVIIVPGTAFTRRGERLGQGGGWYDRFLAGRRGDAVTIGVGFVPQVVEFVPTGAHDVVLDCIVSEDGPVWRDG